MRLRRQFGLSMIEVLVTLTIVAFGLLGLAGLQARSLSFQKDSFDRKAATEVAVQLAELLIANHDGFREGHYDKTLSPATSILDSVAACADPARCTPEEIAKRDWALWTAELRRRLPVSGAYLQAVPGAEELVLTLAWQEGQQTDGAADGICDDAPVNINDPSFRCARWVLHP